MTGAFECISVSQVGFRLIQIGDKNIYLLIAETNY